MYQFPNQQLYHHDPYQHCQLDINDTLKQNVNTIPDPQYHPMMPLNIAPNDIINCENNRKDCEVQPQCITSEKKKKKTVKKAKSQLKESDGIKESKIEKKGAKKSSVDTSTFSIEERLVAGVWVHERSYTNSTISEIKHNFRRRFGREPPSKTTLFAWERKLFSTGNVCDAPRTGRPVNRKAHVSEVAASLRAAPALSLRARALQLQLPRTTLHNILRKDLPYGALNNNMHKANTETAQKQGAKRRARQAPEAAPAPAAAPPAPTPAPAPPHMQYVMHAQYC